MRINRYLARCGVGARRAVETLILQGRVSINGITVRNLATRVDLDSDIVTVDGLPVTPSPSKVFAYHKPRGVVCSLRDPQGRPDLAQVAADLPPGAVPVGRLDQDSEGLLLWATDGDLVLRLTHPRYGSYKTYTVTVAGTLTPRQLEALRTATALEDGTALAYRAEITVLATNAGSTVLEIRLREGKKRQIRRMLKQQGLEVIRLVRVAEAGIELGDLMPGQVREIVAEERAALIAAAYYGSLSLPNKKGETPSGGE